MGKNAEIESIMKKFANSGWDQIMEPANAWLSGNYDREKVIAAIKVADEQCGSCGCEYDALYKRVLALQSEI